MHILYLACLLLLVGCGENLNASGGTEIGNPYNVSMAGVVQKGPFLSGSTVEIYELDDQYRQTGVSQQTRINNKVSRYYCDVTLRSPYAEFYVQGYYFDEIDGRRSAGELALSAIADIQSGRVNINLLTALAENRILNLVTKQGMAFTDAKATAEMEVLRIFGIDGTGLAPFETMNMFEGGDSNAVLLAVSAILMQAAHNMEDASAVPAALSDLIAQIQLDVEEDGMIDPFGDLNDTIAEAIKTVDVVAVRSNLETSYQTTDPTIVIPDFERYITGDLQIHWDINCLETGISTVEVQLLDGGEVLRRNQTWTCLDQPGTGTLTPVNAGAYAKAVLNGRDLDGNIILTEEKPDITITAGETTELSFQGDGSGDPP